jgi:predicted transcriptional regulator
MFNQRRIDILEMNRLLAEGKGQSEVARLLGVSKQAISKTLKKKREGSLTVKGEPKKFSQDGLGPFKQVMHTVLSEIKHLNAEIKTAQAETRERLNIQRLKYCAEARKEFELAIEIDEKRFNIEEVLRFRDYVIQTIGEVDEQTRNEILANLERGRTLKRLVTPG